MCKVDTDGPPFLFTILACFRFEGLVIFSMSGNNTFKQQILQIHGSLFEAVKVRFFLLTVAMEKKCCDNLVVLRERLFLLMPFD